MPLGKQKLENSLKNVISMAIPVITSPTQFHSYIHSNVLYG